MTLSLNALLPMLAALAAALTVTQFGALLTRPGRGAARALHDFTGAATTPRAGTAAPVGSPRHRARLAFASLGMDVTGQEERAILLARLAAAVLGALGIWLAHFPPLTALAGAGLGWIAVDAWIESAWRSQRQKIEAELPTFLSRLSATLQAVPNVLQALDDVVETLDERAPLRTWLRTLITRLQAGGREALDEAQTEAQAISPALGLAVFEIRRLWDTGGAGYAEAFALAADSLGRILEARSVAAAKGDGARSAIQTVLAALVGVTALMAGSPQVGAAFREPIVQLLYLGLAVIIAFGFWFVNGMIDDALN